MTLEVRTARLTILIDPRKKAVFERLCAEEDATPSQVVRRMIRAYIEGKLGRPWCPEEEPPPSGARTAAGAPRRRGSAGPQPVAKRGGGAPRRRAARPGDPVRSTE
ncbi:MAG: hypothetical protein ACREUT_19170 [Steroidobacteraceae bacterium]